MKININAAEVKRSLELLKPAGELFEIRGINGKENISGYFSNADNAINALESYNFRNTANWQLYFSLNNINTACYSREQCDKLVSSSYGHKINTTSDSDILDYEWILIDLDTERPTGISSSNTELERSHQKAANVYQTLKEYGFSEPVTALSGNGYHLLYKVNFKNNSENVQLVKDFLGTLNRLYSDNTVKVDISVFNPARICKLYGSIAAKGTPTAERPHRQAKILTVPAELSETSRDLLQKFVNEHEPPKEKTNNRRLPQRYSGTSFNLADWLSAYNVPIRSTETKNGDNYYILESCPFNPEHTGKDSAIIQKADGTLCFNCFHNSCSDKTWKDFRLFYEPTAYDRKNDGYNVSIGQKTANLEQSAADEKEYQDIIELAKANVLDRKVVEYASRFNNLSDFGYFFDEILQICKDTKQNTLTDFRKRMNDIKKIVKANQNKIEERQRAEELQRRIEERGKILPDWIFVDNKERLRIDEDIYIMRFLECYPLKNTNGTFFDYTGERKDGEILTLIQEDEKMGIRNYINSSLARITSNIFNALKNSVYSGGITPDMKQIHFSNGILSADKDGLFTIWEENKREIYINNLPCTYNPKASLPKKFFSFLRELLFDDDIITLHEWLGYLFLPTNKLQLSLYLQGEGGEGKSVIGNILKELFGDRNFFSSGIEDFDKSRFASSNLENKLFFLDDDVKNGALKNSGIFKTIITNKGKCYVEKKGMQGHSVDLHTRFLLFGNYPLISLYDNSNGFYRRFHYIKVKPKNKNRTDILDIDQTFLDEEKEGIVKWLVDGLNELIKRKWDLYISDRSKEVSDELKFQNDTIRLFLNSAADEDSNIVFGEKNRVPITTLYSTYCNFCSENGFETVHLNGFSGRIQSMQNEYNLHYSKNVPACDKNGVYKRVRGFWGIGIKVISVPNTNYTNNTIDN